MGVLSTAVATDAARQAASLTASDVIDSVRKHVSGDYYGHNCISVYDYEFFITETGMINIYSLVPGLPGVISSHQRAPHHIPGSVSIRFTVPINGSDYFIVVPAIPLTASDGSLSYIAPSFKGSNYTQSVGLGASATITADVSGSAPVLLQWRKNGEVIAGATSATLTINNFQQSDNGNYDCIATNSAGQATSQTFTLALTGTNISSLASFGTQSVGSAKIVTQAELADVNVALYNLIKNLSNHVNADMGVHGLNGIATKYYDSGTDVVGDVVLQFNFGSGGAVSTIYVPAQVMNLGPDRTGTGVNNVYTSADGTYLSPGVPINDRVIVTELTSEILQNIQIYTDVLAYHATTVTSDVSPRICHQGTSYISDTSLDEFEHNVGRAKVLMNINGKKYALIGDTNIDGPPQGPIMTVWQTQNSFHGGSSNQPFYLGNSGAPFVEIDISAYEQSSVSFQWQYNAQDQGGGHWQNLGDPLVFGGKVLSSGITTGKHNGTLWWYTNLTSQTHCLLGGYSQGAYHPDGLRASGGSGIGLFMTVRCIVTNVAGSTTSPTWALYIDGYNS